MNDSLERVEASLEKVEREIRSAAVQASRQANSKQTQDAIEGYLRAGQIGSAVAVLNSFLGAITSSWSRGFLDATEGAAAFLRKNGLPIYVSAANDEQVQRAANEGIAALALAAQQEQQAAALAALAEATSLGLPVNQQAMAVQRAFLATPAIVRTASAFRQGLVESGETSETRIRVGTGRVFAAQVANRIRLMAETLAVRAVNTANDLVWGRARLLPGLDLGDLVRRWRTRADGRVRDSHAAMANQARPYGEPFITGNGFPIRYPGDPMAPAYEVIRCRCVLVHGFQRS